MGEVGVRAEVEKFLSFGDDLIGILRDSKDGDVITQAVEGAKALHSSHRADAHEVEVALEEYQKMINACKEKIDKARGEIIADSEIEKLQNELDEKLQKENLLRQELRVINDEFNDLEWQRISIEERRQLVKKREKDLLRAKNFLSLCASVTKMIPKLDDETNISGFLVERNKDKADKFEIDYSLSPFEASRKLWKMVGYD